MDTRFTLTELSALSPLLILLVGALVILLVESYSSSWAKKSSAWTALATITIALCATMNMAGSEHPLLTPWLRFDAYAKFFTIFFLLIGFAATLLSTDFFSHFQASRGEYYFLLLCSLSGLVLIGSSADFLTLFLGLETLSLSLYILCGYMKAWELSHESSMKYFLMGSLAAAFLLYGIALTYGAIGTTNFNALHEGYKNLTELNQRTLFQAGIALITLGLAFKATVVPFHVWAPDVYEGAPTPITAFMAVGTKTGAFAAFIIVFLVSLREFEPLWNQAIGLLAFPTLIYGNFAALRQTQLRRFFAYSGISHAGYLLIAIAAGTADTIPAICFYLVIYALATLGSFAAVAFIGNTNQTMTMRDLRGLFSRSPFLAGVLSLCLLTLAGIPPTAGFFAKFYVFKIAWSAGYHALVIVGLLASVLAAGYYLRIIQLMLSGTPEDEEKPKFSWPATFVSVFSVAAIILVSCYPAPLMTLLAKLE
jgi:NADH-quinone oxidoreductase subunit N